MLRRTLLPIAIALSLAAPACSLALADDPVTTVDAGAPDAAPVIVVDPGAGTVTPAPGTLPDRVTTDPVGFGQTMWQAIRSGQWRLLAAGILAALMVIGVRLRVRLFGTTDRGKAVAVMVLALLGTTSAGLADIVPLSLELLVGAVTLAFTAVGGRQWLSRFLWPQDGGRQWLVWLKPWLGVLTPEATTPTSPSLVTSPR